MPPARLQDCTDDAFALVGRWLDASRGVKPDARAARLAEVLRDERGLDFARGFVDKVIRPDDPKVAARNLEKASRDVPDFLAWYLRGAVTVGGGFATMAPWAVIPSARRVLRRLAGHLVVDAPPARLGAALGKLGGPGTRLDVVPLGPTVLGPRRGRSTTPPTRRSTVSSRCSARPSPAAARSRCSSTARTTST
jgi:RHH-type proline utilization regulon transcriptional repressor/proline dehydrogenase/delta 1-pyrroline-5-carboxylate dehydrogenase